MYYCCTAREQFQRNYFSVYFVRCVDYNGNGKKYVIFKFLCPPALEFDENLSVCVLSRKLPSPVIDNKPYPTTTLAPFNAQPDSSPQLSSSPQFHNPETDILTLLPPSTSTNAVAEFSVEPSSTGVPSAFVFSPDSIIVPSIFETVTSSPNLEDKEFQIGGVVVETSDLLIPTLGMDCISNKLYRLPNSDCNRFYQCHQRSVNIFSCAPGLVFDEGAQRCLLPEESSCGQQFMKPIADGFFDSSEMDCTSGHFHRYPFDCRNFFQCYNNGSTKSILFYSCSNGLIFDEKSSKCLLPYETSPCYANDSPFKASPFLNHLQRLFQSSPNEFISQ